MNIVKKPLQPQSMANPDVETQHFRSIEAKIDSAGYSGKNIPVSGSLSSAALKSDRSNENKHGSQEKHRYEELRNSGKNKLKRAYRETSDESRLRRHSSS